MGRTWTMNIERRDIVHVQRFLQVAAQVETLMKKAYGMLSSFITTQNIRAGRPWYNFKKLD